MEGFSLFLVVLLALVIPIVMARLQVTTVPTAVAEIIVGIVMGKSCFNIITPSDHLTFLSNLGVIILMFLSGMEINFDLLNPKKQSKARKSESGKQVKPLPAAIAAFSGAAVMSLALAYAMKAAGLFGDVALAAIIFMTVALGVVIATLKEKRSWAGQLGRRSC